MAKRDIKEFEYPPKVNYTEMLKGMWRVSKVDMAFHGSMTILLITGLMIDLLGPYLGGSLSLVRSIGHGYIGVFLILVFIPYLAKVLINKEMRMLFTAVNYLDFLLYGVLIITGISIAAPNKPWVDLLPWLPSALQPIAQNASVLHTVVTYVWLLTSIVFPGGFLHGIACQELMSHLSKRQER